MLGMPLRPLPRRFFLILFLSFLPAAQAQHSVQPPLTVPTFTVPGVSAEQPLKIVVYGDTRFTDPKDTIDTSPRVRQYLVQQIAQEKPDAVFMTGDLPFTGTDPADWQVYRDETASWRAGHLRIYPTLGNHDVKGGWDAGVRNFNATFPELKGYLYYSVEIGNVYLITLDCTQSYAEGSEQRAWLAAQLAHLPKSIDFVFFLSHMPLYADLQSQVMVSLPNPAELSLREFILAQAPKLKAKLIVANGHIHSYERFDGGQITYIISGGGGAIPYRIVFRGPEDQYTAETYPNYHYLVFDIRGRSANATMYRVIDAGAPVLHTEIRDRFTLTAPQP
jgi:hypothetical protein